ncbi:MAG: competence/damage-inducible protein A [Oscillospiraceae bacterium]|nr:competence/damage-inducible protein A [Oscillospiraceae bacterium]
MLQTAEILAVGTEVVQGEIINSNAALIARELTGLGLSVTHHAAVGDQIEQIAAAMGEAAARCDVLIVTGGLGPTCDDLTRESAARCAGVPLQRHPECEEQIRSYYQKKLHAGPMPEENLNQALLPQGSQVLVNDWGTAPGFRLTVGGCELFALPGVPRECEVMLRQRVLPWLKAQMGHAVTVERTLRIFGLGESAVDTLLRERMLALKNPTLAPYAKTGEVELRMTATAPTEAEAVALLDPLEAEVRGILGSAVYGTDTASLEETVVGLLRERGLTLGTAESCTGGLIAKRVTDIPGASLVLKGGIVAYTNAVKQQVLGVPGPLLRQEGAVSAPVAERMALGAQAVLQCDLAVAVTGLAGPETDEFGHTGGTVFLSLTDGQQVWTREAHLGTDRARVRTMTAHTALDMARRYLTGLDVSGQDIPV